MSKTNPDHYFTSTGAELIDITADMNFCLGNCMKYIFRAGRKDGESKLDDLEKAFWYLKHEIKIERAKVGYGSTEKTETLDSELNPSGYEQTHENLSEVLPPDVMDRFR